MKANIYFQRISVSCGLQGYGITVESLSQELWQRHNCLRKHGQRAIWQLDGRRMSGDLGSGTAKIAVSLWNQIRSIAPPGPLQLAGGTNEDTIKHISSKFGPEGVAFGGKARKIIQPWLIESQKRQVSLKDWPEGWDGALADAKKLINPWLSRNHLTDFSGKI